MSNERQQDFIGSLSNFSRQKSPDFINWEKEYRYYNKDYTLEEIYNILDHGGIDAKRTLSRTFYLKDNIYKRILIYYATLLEYSGLLVPHLALNSNLSDSKVKTKYCQVLDYIEKMGLKSTLTRISLRVLLDGAYYGVVQVKNKEEFVIMDLPTSYCSSNYKDFRGRDLIDFDLSYFSKFEGDALKQVLASFPKEFQEAYRKYKNGKGPLIFRVPPELAVYFAFDDFACPMFLGVIPSIIENDEVKDGEIEKQKEEIKKIIVQHVPHLNDGMLLFEPDEAKVMHDGASQMMSGNPNVSVLTTYTDVDAIVSKTTADTVSNIMDKMIQAVYTEAGVSGEIFAPTGALAIDISIKNDIAFMMILGNKYGDYFSDLFNFLFGNQNLTYKYSILPLSIYNKSDFISDSLKLAQSGYSFLLPSIASGISQRDLMSLKDLENNVLKLTEKLIPLSSSYTQSGDPGAPKKDLEDKAPHTIENEESIDRQGGSSQ